MFEFRPLTRADLPLLHQWLNRPHVAQWWQSPSSLEDVLREYADELDSRVSRAYLLWADPAVTKVQTDPSPDNARAIRAYEKAGFKRVRELTTPDGPALLMVVER
jgi:RimJ/RimL family protein N-acetyltransferase